MLAVGGVASGCASDPDPPLPPDAMTAVLVDLHLAEMRGEVDDEVSPIPRDTVLAWHGVDAATFEAAEAHYTEHPAAYRDVYQAVVDSLQSVRADVGDWEMAQQAAPDTTADETHERSE